MLNFMRRHAKGTLIKLLFWMIIIVFVLWGVGTFREGQTSYAAVVNGEEISPNEIRRQSLQLERFYRQLYGENFTPDLAKALDFKSRALDQTINRLLLEQEAARLGLSVGEDEVRDSIARIEGLSQNGVFQREVYFRFVRSLGMTPAQFEDAHRRELLVAKIRNLFTDSIRVDDETARGLWAFTNERVNLSFFRWKASDLAGDVSVSEQELKAYFEKSREAFREPERVTIEYVAYAQDKFEAAVAVADAEVQEEYDLHREDRYSEPEQVRARHVLFRLPPGGDEKAREEAKAKAAAALERAKKGEDFAELARELSDDESNREDGGDLGFFPRGQTEEAFENAVFSLEAGQLSDVVETRFGFHVIKVEEKKPSREKPIEEVRDSIVERLKKERAESAARDAAFEDSQQLASGKSFEEIAKARGIEVQTPPAFARTETLAGLQQPAEVVRAAFELSSGEVGPVTETGGAFCLFRLKERKPTHVPELAAVRGPVETAFKTEKGLEKAREWARKVREALAGGKPIDEVAKAEGLTVEETGPFTRGGDYVLRIGAVEKLKQQAFELGPEKRVAPEVYVSGTDVIVAVLKERLPADMAEFEKDKKQILERYADEQRAIAMTALLARLKKGADIRVNPDALSQV